MEILSCCNFARSLFAVSDIGEETVLHLAQGIGQENDQDESRPSG